jgi:hypothetical protein
MILQLLFCINNELQLSEATVHSRINAIKFYYEQVLVYENTLARNSRPKTTRPLKVIVLQISKV